jgi:hypothetical protein
VLRPGGSLVIETMHRDALMAIYTPTSWEELPGGGLMIERRTFDHERGMNVSTHELVEPSGNRIAAPYEIRVYTATELIGFAREAGSSRSRATAASTGPPCHATRGSSWSRARRTAGGPR